MRWLSNRFRYGLFSFFTEQDHNLLHARDGNAAIVVQPSPIPGTNHISSKLLQHNENRMVQNGIPVRILVIKYIDRFESAEEKGKPVKRYYFSSAVRDSNVRLISAFTCSNLISLNNVLGIIAILKRFSSLFRFNRIASRKILFVLLRETAFWVLPRRKIPYLKDSPGSQKSVKCEV